MAQIPKKFLRIRDAVFILPDDFTGDFRDALQAFLEYHVNANSKEPSKYIDPNNLHTPFDSLCADGIARVCVHGQIFELHGDDYEEVTHLGQL